jgi:hypothetical protein
MKIVILVLIIIANVAGTASAQEGCSEGLATTWMDDSSTPRRWVQVTNNCKTEKHLIAEVLNPETGRWSQAVSGDIDAGETKKGYAMTSGPTYRWVLLEVGQYSYYAKKHGLWQVVDAK